MSKYATYRFLPKLCRHACKVYFLSSMIHIHQAHITNIKLIFLQIHTSCKHAVQSPNVEILSVTLKMFSAVVYKFSDTVLLPSKMLLKSHQKCKTVHTIFEHPFYTDICFPLGNIAMTCNCIDENTQYKATAESKVTLYCTCTQAMNTGNEHRQLSVLYVIQTL